MKATNFQPYIDFLTETAKRELAGCQITAYDGTLLYTPDGVGNYSALWTRDFTYLVTNAWDLLPVHHVKAFVNYLLMGQRDDGCVPDRVD